MNKEKVFKFLCWKFVLTERDYEFPDGRLSDEGGWWTDNGVVYVYLPMWRTWRERIGVLVHEWVEMILEKSGVSHKWAHRVANVIEWIVSLGKATLYW